VVNIAGFSALGRAGDTLNFSDTWSVGESLTKIIGEHTIKFGGDARTMYNNQSNPAGFATFNFAVNKLAPTRWWPPPHPATVWRRCCLAIRIR
jgi:hypothetical protein